MDIDQILTRLDAVTQDGNGFTSQCPAHDDHNPSLAISVGSDDRLLLHCHAGCAIEDIVASLGLTLSDLFPNDYERNDSNNSEADVLDRVARAKHVTVDALKAFGAYVRNNVVRIPMHGPDGKHCSHFNMSADGKKGKNAKGKRAGIFLPGRLPKPGEIWYMVEGVKDAAALFALGYNVVGLPGNTLRQEFVALFRDVIVIIIPDRDAAGERGASISASRLYKIANSVRIAQLPVEYRSKRGLDVRDALAQKNGTALLLESIKRATEWVPSEEDDDCPYSSSTEGMFFSKETSLGLISIPLTNFSARIISKIIFDDGVDDSIEFEIEAQIGISTKVFTVPAMRFNNLSWIPEKLGPEAIVFPGPAIREHTRCAVQMLSGKIAEKTVFQHIGWRRIHGEWLYLHSDGAISAAGSVPGIEVSLVPALQGFVLPNPSKVTDLKNAIIYRWIYSTLCPIKFRFHYSSRHF